MRHNQLKYAYCCPPFHHPSIPHFLPPAAPPPCLRGTALNEEGLYDFHKLQALIRKERAEKVRPPFVALQRWGSASDARASVE